METAKHRRSWHIPSWLNGLCFIPNIGLLFGILLLIIGAVNKSKSRIVWGVFGILWTPVFWFVLLAISEASGSNNAAKVELVKFQLDEMVKELEYYQSKHKKFPDSLMQLKLQNPSFEDIDFFTRSNTPWGNSDNGKIYYKKLSDTTYVLKSKGIDKILDTPDDVLPNLQ